MGCSTLSFDFFPIYDIIWVVLQCIAIITNSFIIAAWSRPKLVNGTTTLLVAVASLQIVAALIAVVRVAMPPNSLGQGAAIQISRNMSVFMCYFIAIVVIIRILVTKSWLKKSSTPWTLTVRQARILIVVSFVVVTVVRGLVYLLKFLKPEIYVVSYGSGNATSVNASSGNATSTPVTGERYVAFLIAYTIINYLIPVVAIIVSICVLIGFVVKAKAAGVPHDKENDGNDNASEKMLESNPTPNDGVKDEKSDVKKSQEEQTSSNDPEEADRSARVSGENGLVDGGRVMSRLTLIVLILASSEAFFYAFETANFLAYDIYQSDDKCLFLAYLIVRGIYYIRDACLILVLYCLLLEEFKESYKNIFCRDGRCCNAAQ